MYSSLKTGKKPESEHPSRGGYIRKYRIFAETMKERIFPMSTS
jgi:hypothetical protein